MTALEELKRRKVVQWALAYLAGAWVALQLVAILAGQFGWPGWIQRGATILLASGLLIALVLAWYHGEKGRQRASGPELLMVAGILVLAGAAIALVRGEPGVTGSEPGASSAGGGPGGVETVAGDARAPGGSRRARGSADADGGPLPSIPERSIAVLPLENLSPDGEHGWFAGAMTEQVTSALSKVPDLRVTSRSSASKFPVSGMTVREFATGELGVAHVLEGSVQRVGDEVQITVQLIDARTDEHLWSETYQRRLTDVLEVQVEIAGEIADRLAASFTEREEDRILAGATDDPVAYDLYLRAQELPWAGITPEELDEKADLLRRAVAGDSTFWMAWADLGITYFGRSRSGEAVWADSGRAALDRAVELSDGPQRAWVRAVRDVLAGSLQPEVLARIRDAAEENPSDPELLGLLAFLHDNSGDLPAAIRYARRAAAVDPLDQGRWAVLGEHYRELGLFDRAEEAFRRGTELTSATGPWRDPETIAWRGLAWLNTVRGEYAGALAAVDSAEAYGYSRDRLLRASVHLWAGDVEEAHATFARALEGELEVGDSPGWSPAIAYVRLLRSDTAGARRMLERAEASLGSGFGRARAEGDPRTALEIAAVRGDAAAAVDALRIYVDAGGRDVYAIQQSPLFSRVRGDSAYRAELAELERVVERQRREVEREGS